MPHKPQSQLDAKVTLSRLLTQGWLRPTRMLVMAGVFLPYFFNQTVAHAISTLLGAGEGGRVRTRGRDIDHVGRPAQALPAAVHRSLHKRAPSS